MPDLSVSLFPSQQDVVNEVIARLEDGHRSITVGGLAGTGKTTVIGWLPEIMDLQPQQVAYCAYTGKAATVINRRYPEAQATTIHRLIYLPVERHDRECPRWKNATQPCAWLADCEMTYRARNGLPPELKLIIVDEASMVPEAIHDQLLSYGVPVVWVGDHGQLPPVMSSFNLMEHPDLLLTEIHRQSAESAILRAAMTVRRSDKPLSVGRYRRGELVVRRSNTLVPGFNVDQLYAGEFTYLVPTNTMRVALNKGVRAQLGYPRERPAVGDRVVCLRNNMKMGVYNGLTGTITWMGEQEKQKQRIEVAVDGEDRTYVGEAYLPQFNNTESLTQEIHREEADLWDYSYALTVHKAQGSEYEHVVVFAYTHKTSERRRWLYTAITRAKKQLEIIYPQ